MRRAIDASNMLRTAASDRVLPAEIDGGPPAEQGTGDIGRAYRGGQLVCACVRVTVGLDRRLGLVPRERGCVRIRFHEPLEDGLRAELYRLLHRRGSAARRAAERVDPIEFVIDDFRGERRRIVGRLQPPQVRHGQLGDIEFGLRELRWRAQ